MGRETDVLMVFYNPTPEEKQEMADARSAMRWAVIAVVFLVIAGVTQLFTFFYLFTSNPKAKPAMFLFIGTFVLAEYARWCSKSSKPESWK